MFHYCIVSLHFSRGFWRRVYCCSWGYYCSSYRFSVTSRMRICKLGLKQNRYAKCKLTARVGPEGTQWGRGKVLLLVWHFSMEQKERLRSLQTGYGRDCARGADGGGNVLQAAVSSCKWGFSACCCCSQVRCFYLGILRYWNYISYYFFFYFIIKTWDKRPWLCCWPHCKSWIGSLK